jgi:PAS domain S-box-containing protein
MWIYGAIVVVAMVIAFVAVKVIHVPEMATKLEMEQASGQEAEDAQSQTNQQLQEIVFDEIEDYVDSKYKRQEIAKAVSNVLDKELDQRLQEHTEELRQKYDKELKEKAQNEEIALKKYNKVIVEKKNTEAVIRSIAEGLVVVDANGKIIMMNPAAEKLLDADKKDKIGKPINDGVGEETMVSLAKAPSEKGDREIELNSTQDETKKTLRSSTAVVENESGETVGMVSVLSDITKQKELDRLKTNFVANVTHELRTPLIAIDKSIALLLTGEPGPVVPQQKQFLDIAERNLKRLANLINDLLDMSKLESGKMSVNLVSISVEKVASDVLKSFESWADSKTISLVKNIDKNIKEIIADQDRIIQVFNNLVGNAIKFTPQGGIITINAEKYDSMAKISVQNTGSGIPKDDLKKIFNKFYQTGQHAPTDISGTGLGLSIAKEIIELHGGEIWVESKENKGTSFIFTLPLDGNKSI